jgi:hypothetical protein
MEKTPANPIDGRSIPKSTADKSKTCTGRDLAEALAQFDLPSNDAAAWFSDLQAARDSLNPSRDKWS